MRKIEDIIWLDKADSTNNIAKCHTDEWKDMTTVAARCQDCGRGQRGNTWLTEPGKNLTFSILMKFGGESGERIRIAAADQFVLSELTSAAIVEFLYENDIRAKIKWPNDIYVGDRKICGILIENRLQGCELNSSVIGIGLNVNQTSFDSSIHPEATSILLETGKELELERALEDFLTIFRKYCRFITTDTEYYKLDEIYNGFIYRKNEEHAFIMKATGRKFRGTIRKVSSTGMLTIEMEEGGPVEFAFNEIAYII